MAENAVPVNGMYDKANNILGTYAMVAAMKNQEEENVSIAMLTVEIRSGNIVGIDVYDQIHAGSVRKRRSMEGLEAKQAAPKGGTRHTCFFIYYYARITMPEFREIVKGTHQSLLSADVLSHFGEERNRNGAFANKARFPTTPLMSEGEYWAEYAMRMQQEDRQDASVPKADRAKTGDYEQAGRREISRATRNVSSLRTSLRRSFSKVKRRSRRLFVRNRARPAVC